MLLLRGPLKDLKSLTPETPAASVFEPIWEFLQNKRALIQVVPSRCLCGVAVPCASGEGS